MSGLLLTLVVSLVAFGCSNIDNTPELVNKLRALGVDSDQAGYSFSTEEVTKTAELTIYLASPLKEAVSFEPVAIQGFSDRVVRDLTVAETDYSECRLFQIKGSLVLPREGVLPLEFDGSTLLPYGIRVNQNSDEEQIRGKIRIYSEATFATLKLEKPGITITFPTSDSPLALGKISLKAQSTEPNDENYRVGWFVASGTIEKRRALEADWQDMSSGRKTIMATIRGLKSYTFGISVVEADFE